ncbi:MAG: dTDP-4-dehydrorhamnose 3,5-epimerase [Betaproteobacteria bacterium]|nr:dTDP-4-dehydrorhamnose 3,5-epimerase [Betaproteobacteria bacterium]
MRLVHTDLPDVLVFEPRVFGDARGFFFESYNRRVMAEYGIEDVFVQDNHSRSAQGVLRGLHYQIGLPQGKLVRCVAGEVFDVAVDLRRRSPTFGQYTAFRLSAENKRMAWIPEGFAHGFLVLSPYAEFLYKTTDFYAPEQERTIRFDDPQLAIAWPLEGEPILSAKDQAGKWLREAEVFA